MSNIYLFQPIVLHSIFSIFFFLIGVPPSYCRDYAEQLSGCSSQYLFPCGSGKLNISYPFWGGNRNLYCGRRGFEIKCDQEKKHHFIELGTQKFRVLNINYTDRRMTIALDEIWIHYCPAIVFQDTVFDHVHFKYGPNDRNLTLFLDCDEVIFPPSPNYISCNVQGEEITGFYVIDVPELQFRVENISNKCEKAINVPVLLAAVDDLRRKNLVLALTQGFEVDYDVDNIPCATCLANRGICASNISNSEQFICLCPEAPQHHNYPLAPPGLPEPPKPAGKNLNVPLKVSIGVGACLVGMGIMATIFWIWLRYRKKKAPLPYSSRNISSDSSSIADLEKADKFLGVHVFTYTELEEATNNFDSAKELGDGGFGTVYYGKLHDGRVVAVKRLYENNYRRVEQFMNEVNILATLRHRNLVTLYGCTSRHSRELLLVYEYISNGTVADHLHGERVNHCALTWAIRLKIAVETADALTFLHASDIIHRDVKTNNILLDDNFCVKVADFGLSRLFPNHVTHVSTAPQGTPGYVDPEYHQCYQLTDKSDVFSFGVVLVELISSMPAVDITRHRHEINLSNMFINKIQNKAVHELVDPHIGFESDYKVRKMIYAVAELAFQCLQGDKDMRPRMQTVLETLKDIHSDGYSKEKAEELDISDDVGLLKNGPPTPSPDSRTSLKTTPSTSN